MNQHYVPRVYLKNFSQQKKKSFTIDVYDKSNGAYFKTNIKKICAEKDLYTLSDDSEVAKDRLAIENLYGKYIEPIYGKSYELLINPKILRITPLQHANILIGIFQLYMRNPKWMYDSIEKHKTKIKEEIRNGNSKNKKSIVYLNKEFDLNEETEDVTFDFVRSEVIKVFKERHFSGTREICTFHADARFEIFHLVDGSSLITGDNPLVAKDRLFENEHPLLRSKEFILPLNNKVGLRMHHDNRRSPYRIYRYSGKNGSAYEFNEKIFKNSSRFILGKEENIREYFKFIDTFENATNDIHKRIAIYKQIVKVAKQYDYGQETKRLLIQFIKKYEETGKVNEVEEQEMYRKIKKDVSIWTKEILKKK